MIPLSRLINCIKSALIGVASQTQQERYGLVRIRAIRWLIEKGGEKFLSLDQGKHWHRIKSEGEATLFAECNLEGIFDDLPPTFPSDASQMPFWPLTLTVRERAEIESLQNLLSKKIGGVEFEGRDIDYHLISLDRKNWYVLKKDEDGSRRIHGIVEEVYPGLMSHLDAWDAFVSNTLKQGSPRSVSERIGYLRLR